MGEGAASMPRVQRTLRGMLAGNPTREVPTSALRGGRGLTRLVGYGAVPVSEFLYNTWRQQQGQRQDLDAILSKLRSQGLVKEVH